jgi:DNA-binding response OmpR family regulator
MRGTVLLIDTDRSLRVAADLFRTSGLIVYHCDELSQALKQFRDIGADVVLVASTPDSSSVIHEVRALADEAMSVIVASGPENREDARAAGADSFLLNFALPADLLYAVHRALILRRSGRRLPWQQ